MRRNTYGRHHFYRGAGDRSRGACALREATKRMAARLNARHLGRADFILGPQGPVFLEWNAMPGFTASSLLPEPLDTWHLAS